MTDWTLYTPSGRLPSAGDLLRAMPTSRLIRLERVVHTDGEETREAVRAAEMLLDLSVILRYQNDSSGALRMTVSEATAALRDEYETLGFAEGPSAAEISIVARLDLTDSARDAGHEDLADDVLSGLDRILPGGVAYDEVRQRALLARDVSRIMNPDETRYSHVDARLVLDEPQNAFVRERFASVGDALESLIRYDEAGIVLRGRFPTEFTAETVDEVWELMLDAASYARDGHVRFRQDGVWSDVVEGIDESSVRTPPEEWMARRKRTVRGVLSRLFRRD